MDENSKIVGIVSHVTIIGWIVAMVLNSQNKSEFGSFYLRQTLGLFIIAFILMWLPIIKILNLVVLGLLIYSLISAASDKKVETPYIGKYFQDIFKGL